MPTQILTVNNLVYCLKIPFRMLSEKHIGMQHCNELLHLKLMR